MSGNSTNSPGFVQRPMEFRRQKKLENKNELIDQIQQVQIKKEDLEAGKDKENQDPSFGEVQ